MLLQFVDSFMAGVLTCLLFLVPLRPVVPLTLCMASRKVLQERSCSSKLISLLETHKYKQVMMGDTLYL